MKIFIGIGTTHMQLVSTRLLEESLQRHAGGHELVIRSIYEEPEYQDIASLGSLSVGTVFSLQRFLVAKIGARHGCEFAMHIDSDILCLNDFDPMIRQFAASDTFLCIASANPQFRQPVQSAVLLTRTDARCQEFFAKKLQGYVSGAVTYAQLMASLCDESVALRLEHIYNSRDFVEDRTVFLHYTDLWTQPWVAPFRKEGAIWLQAHFARMAADSAYRALVEEGVAKGYYRPGLLKPAPHRALKDLFFLPPQMKVYAGRYPVLRWLPDQILGMMVQLFSGYRAGLNVRTT